MSFEAAFSSRHHRFAWYEGGSLFDFLERQLPIQTLLDPNSSWQERAEFGGIFINGLRVFADQPLPLPALVEYYEPKFDFKNAHTFYPPFDSNWIVFEDEFLLVVFKPARLPTMPAKEQHLYSLRLYIDTYIGKEAHCPSRLDMSTQGLVVISKEKSFHKQLQQLFEQKKIQKHYLFLTHTQGADNAWQKKIVDAPIGKTPVHPVLRVIDGRDAKPAQTIITRGNENSFLDLNGVQHHGGYFFAEPLTGRTHQIRIHAASLGLPIVGDRFYGQIPHAPLGLLSWKVAFVHPETKAAISIELPPRLIPKWAKNAIT